VYGGYVNFFGFNRMVQTRKVSRIFPKVVTPEKPWIKKKRYQKWVKKLTRKSNIVRTSEEDLCAGEDSICKGDLGISRKYMPQFLKQEDVKRFRKFIKKAYGIKSSNSTRRARDLRPSQREISRKRIKNMIEKEEVLKKVLVPLIISNDNYIVDGHHRWAAYRMKMPDKRLPVVVFEAPIKDVLGLAVAWGAKHQDF